MRTRSISVILITLLFATNASAVKIADITRIGGQRSNVLTGLGLIYGLKGTGDGGDFQPAIKPLAAMLAKFSDTATVAELKDVNNVRAGQPDRNRSEQRGARRRPH